ncbi:mannitol dehydrogenase family protein [Nitratireductor sp. ZSWI3]|uniref:mannitol dehydrogenase family protein n=1 Tax=Nitratireductor sp. ZSWI3 TaxID=2966359 RepID=UPI0021502C9A|nr:mannitol dehydrogenase family protein [Nitratireductor sp. ZSWI3]MCR4264625.1 mannitol dehydrogenase family protein [Nitratireductor sp. ZSWI3]
MKRLAGLDHVKAGVRLPAFAPDEHGSGIVHLGLGAFHRAHQAAYTDNALAAAGGDWRIVGVSLRGTATAAALNPQNGLYTLIERGATGTSARIIGSISRVLTAAQGTTGILETMADRSTRIVSLTVTEKAYGIDRAKRTIDRSHPAIDADLADPRHPAGVLGLIVEALRLRRQAGIPPFTVLCCDNLPENGALLRAGVVSFADAIDAELGLWIGQNVSFPSTMVDRITPAATEETLAEARRLTGCEDHAAIETEPFSQWVIEDDFPLGRPHWEAGGAIFVSDVAPYERMKLRMLNGTHSMLAYAGFLSGCTHVRDVMAAPALARLVARHLQAAAATLEPLAGIDFGDYTRQLTERFSNPAIAHETYQIAMDGTEKLPQRLLKPAVELLDKDGDIRPFAFAVAAWMRYCLGRRDDGSAYALRDPLEARIRNLLAGVDDKDAAAVAGALHALPGLFPQELSRSQTWRRAVERALSAMLETTMGEAIRREVRAMEPSSNMPGAE